MSDSSTTHILNTSTNPPPQTATKPPRVLKKRGRKGEKIANAFKNIPCDPINFSNYAKSCGVTTNVLRQIKRHDQYKETGKVYVRKNKESGIIMIWRASPE